MISWSVLLLVFPMAHLNFRLSVLFTMAYIWILQLEHTPSLPHYSHRVKLCPSTMAQYSNRRFSYEKILFSVYRCALKNTEGTISSEVYSYRKTLLTLQQICNLRCYRFIFLNLSHLSHLSLGIRGPEHSNTINDIPAKNTVIMHQKSSHIAAVARKGLQMKKTKKTDVIENGISWSLFLCNINS